MAKIDFAHKAQRKMFEVVLDAAIKHSDSDRRKALMQLVDLIEKTLGDVWGPAAYKMFRDIFSDPDSKWMKYANNLLDDVHPNIIKGRALTQVLKLVSEVSTLLRNRRRSTAFQFHG